MAREMWYQEEINKMLRKITEIKTKKELETLFNQIVTAREINDMARRFEAINLLNDGTSYSEIRQRLGLSPIIIARLSGNIGYGYRRSSEVVKIDAPKRRYKKPPLRYKGAVSIHRMFD